MHRVLKTDEAHWTEKNLDACFYDSVKHLVEGLSRRSIVDIFFQQVLFCFCFVYIFIDSFQFNMLDLIEEKDIIDNCAKYLEKALEDAQTPAGLFLQKPSPQQG